MALDDSFSGIVDAIKEGRLVFENLKKSISYGLSSNVAEITPFVFALILGMPLPFTTVLLLVFDLSTDILPAIALAFEPPESDLMTRPPRDLRTDSFVKPSLWMYTHLQVAISPCNHRLPSHHLLSSGMADWCNPSPCWVLRIFRCAE